MKPTRIGFSTASIPLAYANAHGLDEEQTIGAFVHAARLGLFDMSWNMMCPSCGGVLETGAALKNLNQAQYYCSFCTVDCEPTLDKLVEVTFTVNPRIRRIAAHDPDSLSFAEYMRQIFWSSSNEFPDDVEERGPKGDARHDGARRGRKGGDVAQPPQGICDRLRAVTHSSLFLEVEGEETQERRNLSLVFADAHAHSGTQKIQPGPARISFENKADRRTMPGIWLHSKEMDKLTHPRRPFLTATRLLSNQAFRDLYRSGTFDPEQRFKITSLTILFTDLRGSTALYDRIGDLAAFDLVRSHFGALLEAVSAEGGAVVKTIGDAVMATFPTPDRALRAAMRMREAMREINRRAAARTSRSISGCMRVRASRSCSTTGRTISARRSTSPRACNELADPTAILATKPIIESSEVARVLSEASYRTTPRSSQLRGLSDEFEIFEVRERETPPRRSEASGLSSTYRPAGFCRPKTSCPSRSRMRKAIVLGGHEAIAAAMIAAETSEARISSSRNTDGSRNRWPRPQTGSETVAAWAPPRLAFGLAGVSALLHLRLRTGSSLPRHARLAIQHEERVHLQLG